MITVVTGTSDSGKSSLAEDLAVHTGDRYRYYLATMRICDEEGRKRVLKHKRLREGKGFITLELERDIGDAAKLIPDPEQATILLECVANLVGNEMHDDMIMPDADSVCTGFADRIFSDIKRLAQNVGNMIIVTNEYAERDNGYDDETRLYVKLLKLVNDRLYEFADEMYDMRKTEEE